MLDNYPPDATPEQKGMPRSFISAAYVPPEERMRGNTDPIPLDVTPEQKGMPRSFFVDPSKLKGMDPTPWPETPPGGVIYVPLDVTPTDEANIARNARTYGG